MALEITSQEALEEVEEEGMTLLMDKVTILDELTMLICVRKPLSA
jgi:hypothetical protein